ncbi:MAG: CAP domain-containing protein [Acidobacteriota bacterium]
MRSPRGRSGRWRSTTRKPDRLRICGLAAALLLSAAPAAFAASEDLPGTFLKLVNAQREREGLRPLVLDPALSRAAQAHADDMTARQVVGFATPEGRQVEDWIRAAGYNFQLVTEKLATTPDPPEAMAADWARWPDSNRKSLLNPDVRDLGVGIGEVKGTPVYVFVLARSEKSYLERYVAELYERQELALRSLDTLREDLLGRINEARAGAKIQPLTRHPALERAAQEYAEGILVALHFGSDQPLKAAGSLAAKVKAQGYRSAGYLGTIGERVVFDALTPDQALSALLGEDQGRRSTLLGRGFTQMGIGVAFERTAEGFRVVWVQCLARPAATPTTANAQEEPEGGR